MSNFIWYETKMTSNTTPAPYVASASSVYSTTYPAWKAFDGDNKTNWLTAIGSPTGWIQIDYGKSIDVSVVRLSGLNTTSPALQPKNLIITASVDGVSYKEILKINNEVFNQSQDIVYTFPSVKARYLKVSIIENNGSTYTGLSDIKFGYKKKYLVLKNPTTNQHYSLAEKTLIYLPDTSTKNMILYGIEQGKEIQLDVPFDKIKTVIDNGDGTQTIIDKTVNPFSVYDYISETPEVLVYTESTDDITVSTTTEPFDIYDEFGDEVEVLFYTDDEVVTEANLTLEANWSPIDELEGDFEVVTWTDEDGENTAVRELNIGAVPIKQVTETIKYLPHGSTLRSVVAEIVKSNPYSKIKFALSNGFTYLSMSPKNILGETNVQYFNNRDLVFDRGMDYDQIGDIPTDILDAFTTGDYKIVVGIDKYIRDYSSLHVESVTVDQAIATISPTVYEATAVIINNDITLRLNFLGSVLKGTVEDLDKGKFKYKATLNGDKIYPENEDEWSPWVRADFDMHLQLNSSMVKIDQNNTLVLTVEDWFGNQRSQTFSFIGEYTGLLFKDPMNGYYTNDAGEILKYLSVGVLQQGQVSPQYEVHLINNNPFEITNTELVGQATTSGVNVELSKTDMPFIQEINFKWDEIISYKEVKPFFVRLRVAKDAELTNIGEFSISVESDVVED